MELILLLNIFTRLALQSYEQTGRKQLVASGRSIFLMPLIFLLPAGPQYGLYLTDFLQGGGNTVKMGVVAYRNAYFGYKFGLVARLAPLIYGKRPH